ncbi:MAG TPA: GAF domain-containing protein [Planctomycetota bacterium]|nr:GAF domain-containing protein [Planctomycetota bacterium]
MEPLKQPREDIIPAIESLLDLQGAEPVDRLLERVLDKVLESLDCAVGTLHELDPSTNVLVLRAQRGVPDSVLAEVRRVPVGKGMAGLAAERRAPVQVCNLQTDASGVARPGARATGAQGSIAVPVLVRGELRGAFGVGKRSAHDFSEAEAAEILRVASLLGERLF